MNKKFYYIANIRLPTEKAHGTQIMKMCEAFADLGQDVELIIPQRKTDIKEDPFIYYGVKRNFKITRLWSLDLIQYGRIGFIIQTLTFAESTAWNVLFKKGTFYTRDSFLAFYLRILGKKIAWEIHMERANFAVRNLIKSKVPLVAITQGLKDTYLTLGASSDKILVAHDGVDLEVFKRLPSRENARIELSLPLDKTIVAYIGKYTTLGESKGVEDIIEPFKSLLDSTPNIYLLIVGPEINEVKMLEEKVTAVGIPHGSYKVIPRVPHTEQFLYMKAADILLLMYPNTRHYAHFMSPLKLFDYMASEAVIVTSDLPSIREVVNDSSACFFNPGDTASFEKALQYALQPSSVQKAKQAYEDVAHRTWFERAGSILKFLV